MQMEVEERTTAERVLYLPIGQIAPSPVQPRRQFRDDTLRELAGSIARYGVLQPLTVRRRGGCYELISGERRLRAARLAGLTQVPCLLLDVNMEQSGILALVENLQREDLDFIEQARGIARLIEVFGLSLEEAASRLDLSRPAVSNKLRILRLPPELLDELSACGLGERHARALLRLPDAAAQWAACRCICDEKLSASAAERYIDRLLSAREPRGSQKRSARFILKDVRVFLNSIDKGVGILKEGGIDARVQSVETEAELVVTVRIPKSSAVPADKVAAVMLGEKGL